MNHRNLVMVLIGIFVISSCKAQLRGNDPESQSLLNASSYQGEFTVLESVEEAASFIRTNGKTVFHIAPHVVDDIEVELARKELSPIAEMGVPVAILLGQSKFRFLYDGLTGTYVYLVGVENGRLKRLCYGSFAFQPQQFVECIRRETVAAVNATSP